MHALLGLCTTSPFGTQGEATMKGTRTPSRVNSNVDFEQPSMQAFPSGLGTPASSSVDYTRMAPIDGGRTHQQLAWGHGRRSRRARCSGDGWYQYEMSK